MRNIVEGLEYSGKPISPFRFEPPVALGNGVVVYADVEIGAHSYMNSRWIRERVTIGRFCSIAYNVTIGMGNHATHLLSSIRLQRRLISTTNMILHSWQRAMIGARERLLATMSGLGKE